MSNRILIEYLDNERVQQLIELALEQAGCNKSPKEVLSHLRQVLRESTDSGQSKWIQTQFNI